MTIKKIIEKYTPEEIAESFVFPPKLTATQQREANNQLADHRTKRRMEMSEGEKLHFELLQLKFQLEDYLKADHYNPQLTFGLFLEQYLQLTKLKKKEFAKDIHIHETQLSQIIKGRRDPNDSIMIRLELHSSNTIPAIDWFKLLEKEKGHQIKTDRSLRNRESRHVTNTLELI